MINTLCSDKVQTLTQTCYSKPSSCFALISAVSIKQRAHLLLRKHKRLTQGHLTKEFEAVCQSRWKKSGLIGRTTNSQVTISHQIINTLKKQHDSIGCFSGISKIQAYLLLDFRLGITLDSLYEQIWQRISAKKTYKKTTYSENCFQKC